MNFDGQGITDTGSTRVHGATLITPRYAIGLRRPAQANPTKKLGPDTIRNCIHYLRAVVRRIHVHSERPLAKGSIHHLNDGLRDSGHIGLRGHNRRETFHDVVGKALIGTYFVFGNALLICGKARMREVIRTRRERTGNDNRGFDVPSCQFPPLSE
jgi:hypothetical protein